MEWVPSSNLVIQQVLSGGRPRLTRRHTHVSSSSRSVSRRSLSFSLPFTRSSSRLEQRQRRHTVPLTTMTTEISSTKATPSSSSSSSIHYGDVIQLRTLSAFVEPSPATEGGDPAASECCLGFYKHKQQLLLVVPASPTEFTEHKLVEAQFIVWPIPGDKTPPALGTPLSYKQGFVLKTSDGSGYTLNNKTPGHADCVSLLPIAAKGMMNVVLDKPGASLETAVQDGDSDVAITVVHSNRNRRTFNKTLTHFIKPQKATIEIPGGYVSSSGKGAALRVSLRKVPDAERTPSYIKDPVVRRLSQQMRDLAKADETSEASRLDSPTSASASATTSGGGFANPPSRSASVVLAAALPIPEDNDDGNENDETGGVEATTTTQPPRSPLSDTTTAESGEPESGGEEKLVATTKPLTPAAVVMELAPSELTTIDLSGNGADLLDAMQGSVPVYHKMMITGMSPSPSPREAPVVGSNPFSSSSSSSSAASVLAPSLATPAKTGSTHSLRPRAASTGTTKTCLETERSAVSTRASDVGATQHDDDDDDEVIATFCVGKCTIM